MFTHLDDPTPYVPPAGLLPAVRRRARRRRQRRAALVGGVASVTALGVGSVAAVRDRVTPEQIHVGGLAEEPGSGPLLAEGDPADPDDPVTFLVVGTDRTGPDDLGYADTIALVRLVPGSGEVRLLTVPRDLLLTVDDLDVRASEAFAAGGPQRLVRGITATLDVPIHHFVQADLTGAVGLVDALGGIRVEVDRPIRDEPTGLDLAGGCQELDGEAALALGRARHVEVRQPDGTWAMDPSSAVGREVRGAVVATALLRTVGRAEPSDLPALVETGLRWLTVDASLGTDDLVDWARDARDDRVVPLGLPLTLADHGGQEVLRLVDGAADVVAAFHDGGSDPIPVVVDGDPVSDPTGLHPC